MRKLISALISSLFVLTVLLTFPLGASALLVDFNDTSADYTNHMGLNFQGAHMPLTYIWSGHNPNDYFMLGSVITSVNGGVFDALSISIWDDFAQFYEVNGYRDGSLVGTVQETSGGTGDFFGSMTLNLYDVDMITVQIFDILDVPGPPDGNIQPVNFYRDSGYDNFNFNMEPVPEPSTILLFGSGLAGLAWYGRKRKKA